MIMISIDGFYSHSVEKQLEIFWDFVEGHLLHRRRPHLYLEGVPLSIIQKVILTTFNEWRVHIITQILGGKKLQ